MKKFNPLLSVLGVSFAGAYSLKKYSQQAASANNIESKFNFAVTLNPYFEKRYKQGEDNFVVRDNFICVTDGVGGWIRKLEDTGLFTKEYVKHIAALYDNGQYSDLKELLDNAS